MLARYRQSMKAGSRRLVWVSLTALGCGPDTAGEETTWIPEHPCGLNPGACSDSAVGDTGMPETSSTGSSGEVDDGTSAPADSTGVLKLDVASADTGDAGCSETDVCCLEPGELPPHALLDSFLAAYPAALMPMSVDALVAFMPEADGHAMAFNLDNLGDEFVDPSQGGVVAANLDAGRAYSKSLADAVVPITAEVLDVREDQLQAMALGAVFDPCQAVGWGWGSVLFAADDSSIREVVYLYIGYCADDGDGEAFFYSDEAEEICAPPR